MALLRTLISVRIPTRGFLHGDGVFAASLRRHMPCEPQSVAPGSLRTVLDTALAEGMKADYLPADREQDPNTQDPHRMVQCTAQPDVLWVQHHCGLYRSINGGQLWEGIAAPKPSGFGFAVACDPVDPQRAWFVPAQADTQRYPLDGKMVVNRTDDGGKTFTTFTSELPQEHAYHLVYRHSLEPAPDRQTLAMSSTTGSLWISADAGEHWQCVFRDLPPVAALGGALTHYYIFNSVIGLFHRG